jgi:hypothetical protein
LNGSKVYDSYRNAGNDMYGIINGLIRNENVTISDFIGTFKDPNAGNQLIDISNVILSGFTAFNYYIKPIPPVTRTIYQKSLIASFSDGTKIYDATNFTGPIVYSLSGQVGNEIITISTFISKFKDPLAGSKLIDISNVVLSSLNYNVLPIQAFRSTIFLKDLVLSFYGGEKIYDSRNNTGPTTWSISGIIGNEILTISNYLTRFKIPTVGYQLIDISYVIIMGLTINNYNILPIPPISRLISQKELILTFFNGSKIYDSYRNANDDMYGTINGLIRNEIVTISSFIGTFQNPNVGNQLIDISNVILSGFTAFNYYIKPIPPITKNIYQKSLIGSFSGGSKIYDATNFTGPILYSLSGQVGNEIITISTFISKFKDPNVGINFIDISNVILSSLNYYVTPIQSFSSIIYLKDIIVSFYDGDKIYDSTNLTGPMTWSISGIIGNEKLTISSYLSRYKITTVGYQLIDISYTKIFGLTAKNYNILPVLSIDALISQKQLLLIFYGGSKTYDSYNNPGDDLYGTISGIINNEIITISSFIGLFQNPNAGYQLIDISNVILSGNTAFNYYIQPIQPLLRIIYLKSITLSLTGGSKIYNKLLDTSLIEATISGSVANENIYLVNLNSHFVNYNAGINNIIISNILLGGDTSTNYIGLVPNYSAIIHQKPILINSVIKNKIYDATSNINSNFIPYLANLEFGDNVNIIKYNGNYTTKDVGLSIIDISNILLSGIDSKNYKSNFKLSLSAFIDFRLLTINFGGINKIYDGLRNIYNLPYKIINSVDDIELLYYEANYKDQNVGRGIIDISNVTLSGDFMYNYIIEPILSVSGIIRSRNLTIIFSGGSKIYDRTIIPGSSLSYDIINIANNENIDILTFTSQFDSNQAGNRRIDISNLLITGPTQNNYKILPINPVYTIITKKLASYGLANITKVYNKLTNVQRGFNSYITDIIPDDIVILKIVVPVYTSSDVGYNIPINISDIVFIGDDVNNYSFSYISSSGIIIPKGVSVSFSGGTKNYDKTYETGTISGFFFGVIPGDIINLGNYTSKFRNNQVGFQIIDVSNVTFSGPDAHNYFASSSISFTSRIFSAKTFALFTIPDKEYDSTRTVYNAYGTLYNIVEGDSVFIQSFNAKYVTPNIGYNRVDISNVIITGINVRNYTLLPQVPSYSNIVSGAVFITIYGGDKIYDSTNITGPFTRASISGTIENINIRSFTSYYTNINYGYQLITISNIVFSSSLIYNYYLVILPVFGFISQKPITISFYNINKIYDKTNNILNTISGVLNSVYPQDSIYILSFTGNYKKNVAGLTFLDISNITTFGVNANNYNVINPPSLPAIIYQKSIIGVFNGGNKIYDNTTNVNNLQYYLINTISGDNVFINSYNANFDSVSVGNRLINFSNPILSGLDSNNYIIQPINSISSFIYPRYSDASFNVLNKIYDNNSIAYLYNPTLTNIDVSDTNFVSIYSYYSTYDNMYVGINKSISIINITLSGLKSNNYILNNSIIFLVGSIYQKRILINPIIQNKIYDQNNIAFIQSFSLSGVFISDISNVFISNYNGTYYDSLYGLNKLVTINNITLSGILGYNYYTIPINTLGNILQRQLFISFTGVNKVFDNNTNANVINPIINGILPDDIVFVSSYNSNFINIDVGINKDIIINNFVLSGSSSNNYISISSYTKANIITSTHINLSVPYPNSTYLDLSNNINIILNPIWERQLINYSDKVININNLFVFLKNGIIYNNLTYLNINNIINNVSFNENNYIISSISGLIYYSLDNLTTINTINTNINQNIINVTPIKNNISYLITNNQVYKSINTGLNWTLIYSDISNQFVNIISLDISNVFIVGYFGLYLYTLDGGISWSSKNLINQKFNQIFMYDIYTGFIVGNSGLIYKTLDGIRWLSVSYNTVNNLNNISSSTKNDVLIVGDNGLILRSNTRGNSWSVVTSNTGEHLTCIYTLSTTNIRIGGQNSVLINYILSASGLVSIYDNTNLIINQSVNTTTSQLNFNLTQYNVKRYLINAQFTPFNSYLYSSSNTNNILLIIKPKLTYFNPYIEILYDSVNPIFSENPLYDQSGGIFNIIDTIGNLALTGKATININGQLTFNTNILVNKYSLISIYSLHNTSNQFIYNVNIIPNIIYPNNLFYIQYLQKQTINTPYTSPLNGIFTISDVIGSLVSTKNIIINTISGIITIFNNTQVSNNKINVRYIVNNISNHFLLNIIILPIINYSIGIQNLDYSSTGISEQPIVNPKGGIFIINDISGNFVLNNQVTITNSGIINFSNTLPVGFVNFNVLYNFKNIIQTTQYKLNVMPVFKYTENTKTIEYIRNLVDSSSIPMVNPVGGYFNFIDLSSGLISNNYIVTDTNTGKILYLNNIYPGSYSLFITYNVNLAYKSLIYNVIVKPSISLIPNNVNIIYKTITSINPCLGFPLGGKYTITEIDNILYQTKFINIDSSSGIIYINTNPILTINIGTFNFRINYIVNGIVNSKVFTLNIIPTFYYSINTTNLNYDSSGYSVSGNVFPLGGLFSISGLLPNKIKINSNNGILYFDKYIPSDYYIININYLTTNLKTQTKYYLTIFPSINYNNLIQLYEQTSIQYSNIPYVNPNNGIYSLNDLDNSIINYINIDLSGVISIQPGINVGNYNINVYYNVNNIISSTIFQLTIKPNISIINNTIELQYNREYIYYSEQPYVNQKGGIFSAKDINGYSIIDSISGIIQLLTNIPVNTYTLQTIYTLNNSFNSINTYFTIKPVYFYTISSIIVNYNNTSNSVLPNTYPNGGFFYLYDISSNLINYANTLITINQYSGLILVNNNINVGNYIYLINYIVNQIKTFDYFTLTVLPNIIYYINEKTILYNTSGYSMNPDYSQKNGIFTIYDFSNNYVFNNYVSIDLSGIIYFNSGVDVGIHIFIINYSLNNIINQTTYTLNVLPLISYNPNNISLLYRRNTQTFSSIPNYLQLNGSFLINDYIGELVQNGNVNIDISSGIIIFNDLINVNNYSFVVYYLLNNLQNSTIYNLLIIPNINYNIGSLSIFYGYSGNSEIPIVEPINGLFSILDISGGFLVKQYFVIINKNTGLINVNSATPVGTYQVTVFYTINKIFNSFTYNIIVQPTLIYKINTKNIDYSVTSYSIVPIYNPKNGIFNLNYNESLSGKVLVNQSNGQLIFKNDIDVGNYIINIKYTFNFTNTIVNYNLIVSPVLIYNNSIQTILYNHDITFSEYPIYYQKGGIFTLYDLSNTIVSDNLLTIDSSGLIFFANYINIGNYGFLINYTLNLISVNFFYSLNILPNITYNSNINEIKYKDTFNSGIPYIDPSGGIFFFQDISGYMIRNNLLDTDYINGLIILNKIIDVGKYTILVNYQVGKIINNTIFILNIAPIIEYSIGVGSKVFSSISTSEKPYFDQPGGLFYLDSINDSINSLTIDPSNGIIYFNFDLDVNNYNFNIYYKLNGIASLFIYKYLVYPLIDYDNLFINTVYNTSIITNNALIDPPGGLLYLTPYDLSNNIIQNYIDISYITLDPNNGIVYFDQNISVGKYLININYLYNNILNSVMLTFIMKPYILYPIGSLTTPYRDISFSEIPLGLPPGGYYDATVPRISLVYTGISINHTTGIIRFGFVNAGFWILTCTYTFNYVSITQNYYLNILADVYYTPPYEVIPYNSLFTTQPPTIKNKGGVFNLIDQTPGFSINQTTGSLTFTNLTAGVYYNRLSYTIFGNEIIINYTLVVKPTVNYNPSNMQTTYTNSLISSTPTFNPISGIFSIFNNDPNNPILPKDIYIDISSGIIYTTPLLRVNQYNTIINYTVNESTEIINFTISIYPNFTFPIGFMNVLYGSNYLSEKAIVNPKRGIFISINPKFAIDSSGGRLLVTNTNNVGKYILPIRYTYNSMSVIYNYNLIINPLLLYANTNYSSIYGNTYKSDQPLALEYNGVFNIKLINSTNPIGIIYNSTNIDIYNDYSLIFNSNLGILYFGNKISVGYYNFKINYSILDLSSNVNFNYTVLPNIYYSPTTLNLGYQTVGQSRTPFCDQSGGFFTFTNTLDFINQISKINLNNKTGIISFYKGVDVGNYNFKIAYTLNNITNITNYYLSIKPIYYYNNNKITIIYDNSGNSEYPYVLNPGGQFYIDNNAEQNNISINLYTGIISFGQIYVGNYILTLRYIYNSSFSQTNYNITIIPNLIYPIGYLNISYGSKGISEFPYTSVPGGIYNLYNLDDYGNQNTKLTIDSLSGIIYFNNYINSGIYNTIISYTLNGLTNYFNYILYIDPYLDYDISGPINLYYNNSIIDLSNNTIYKTNIPFYSPIGGVFYFKDNSSNLLQNNIELNKLTGQINIYNKPPVNFFYLNVQYFIKNLKIIYPLSVNIYPNLIYKDYNIIINYNTNNTIIYSDKPYYDPSGGIFKFVTPLNINLFNKIFINNYGQITFNTNISVGNYSMSVNYIITNTNILTNVKFNILVLSTVIYKETTLNLLFNTIGYSSIPKVLPYGGVFDISNNIYNQSINSFTGQLKFENLNVGSYLFYINYLFNNIKTQIQYNINIISLINYNPSQKIEYYSIGGQTNSPNVDLVSGFFSIPYNFSLNNIFIDSSNGFIIFTNETPVGDYLIPVSYTIFNLSKTINYNLIIKPYIYYDISSFSINYNDIYKINNLFVNPKGGIFSLDLYDLFNNLVLNTITITNSGFITIKNVDISSYTINVNYNYKNIISQYLIKFTVFPILYYINIFDIIYLQNSSSNNPIYEPLNGTFTILNLNIGFINDNGIIYFNSNLDISNYSIQIQYTKNFISTIFNYNFNVIPYINYNINNTTSIGGFLFNTISAFVLPSNGTFNLINNENLINIDNNGIIYFDASLNVNIYNIVINYSFNNLINSFIYNHSILPYVYYDDQIYNYGLINYSNYPKVNTNNSYFLLEFIIDNYIQTSSISIDSSSGIIIFDNEMPVGSNSFNVVIYKNGLTNKNLFNFIIKPNLNYDLNYELVLGDNLVIRPNIFNPLGGIFYLYSDYNFITLIDENTGEIIIFGSIIGKFNINIDYTIFNISNNVSIEIIVKSSFYYPNNYEFIYTIPSNTDIPTVSLIDGIYYFSQDISNIFIDTNTGIISTNEITNVNIYNLLIYYQINDTITNTNLQIIIKPKVIYEDDFYIEYGIAGFTNTPTFIPTGGLFSLIDQIDGITIDENNGSIILSSIVKKNDYVINVKYSYNNIESIELTNIFVTAKTIEVLFIIFDKIYDGTSELKVKSNKISGVINNDKVFILSYNASFLSSDVALDVPVNITDIELGGPDVDNYFIEPDANTVGNINYLYYQPNIVKVNKGTKGNSNEPNISEFMMNPSFIIKQPIDGIIINDYGVIYWDDTLDINTYNIQVLVYNLQDSFTIIFTLIVTTNLYSLPISIDLPNIQNNDFEYSTYQLRYTTTSGLAYAVESDIPSTIAKFDIRSYINGNLNHDLESNIRFTFILPNAKNDSELILYELNDDNTINPKYQYVVTYLYDNVWTSTIRYLSDFYVQDNKTNPNIPPIISPTNINNKFFGSINVTITGLPNSVIYYTTDNSVPSIDSNLYTNTFLIKNSCTIKAISYTPGYLPSAISQVNYIIIILPCILTNSLIKTSYGYEIIDNLKVDDLIMTPDNRIVSIKSILKYEIVDPKEYELPVIIPKDFFDINIPNKDTYLSETHAILVPNTNNEWILPKNNINLFKRKYTKIIYYNLELTNYFTDNIVVNNLPIESWSSGKYKYKYSNKIQKIINKKKLIIYNKIKL